MMAKDMVQFTDHHMVLTIAVPSIRNIVITISAAKFVTLTMATGGITLDKLTGSTLTVAVNLFAKLPRYQIGGVTFPIFFEFVKALSLLSWCSQDFQTQFDLCNLKFLPIVYRSNNLN